MEKIHRINILLMENEEQHKSILKLLEDFSSNNQIEFFVFENANKLLDYLNHIKIFSNPYRHNIVLFHSKPPLNHVIEVINEIKANSDLKITPVFIITESVNDEDIRKAYKCHTNCYIAKPHDMEGLIQIVNSFKELWLKFAKLT